MFCSLISNIPECEKLHIYPQGTARVIASCINDLLKNNRSFARTRLFYINNFSVVKRPFKTYSINQWNRTRMF